MQLNVGKLRGCVKAAVDVVFRLGEPCIRDEWLRDEEALAWVGDDLAATALGRVRAPVAPRNHDFEILCDLGRDPCRVVVCAACRNRSLKLVRGDRGERTGRPLLRARRRPHVLSRRPSGWAVGASLLESSPASRTVAPASRTVTPAAAAIVRVARGSMVLLLRRIATAVRVRRSVMVVVGVVSIVPAVRGRRWGVVRRDRGGAVRMAVGSGGVVWSAGGRRWRWWWPRAVAVARRAAAFVGPGVGVHRLGWSFVDIVARQDLVILRLQGAASSRRISPERNAEGRGDIAAWGVIEGGESVATSVMVVRRRISSVRAPPSAGGGPNAWRGRSPSGSGRRRRCSTCGNKIACIGAQGDPLRACAFRLASGRRRVDEGGAAAAPVR